VGETAEAPPTKLRPGDRVVFLTPRAGKMRHGVVDGYHRLDPNVLRIIVTSREGTKYRVYRHVSSVRKAT